MSNISAWSTTAANNNAAVPDGWPENGVTVPNINNTARESHAAIRRFYENIEFRDWGHTVTYASATSFTISGDQTETYVEDRPIKCTDSSTLYGKVSSSTYSAPDTTVNVTLDSGSLSGSLTAVALGIDPTGDPIGVEAIRGLTTVCQPLDSELTALAGLTSAANKVPMFSGSGTATLLDFKDEDDMASDSATAVSSQQSIKAYIAAQVSGLGITLGTPVASTSGTSIDFTSIPAGTKRINIMLSGVSTSGTSQKLIQLGDSGGIETSGYLGAGSVISAATVTSANYTTGFGLYSSTAAAILHGTLTLTLLDAATNTWACSGVAAQSNSADTLTIAGSKELSAELDRVRITTVGGTDTFDAGTINISYE